MNSRTRSFSALESFDGNWVIGDSIPHQVGLIHSCTAFWTEGRSVLFFTALEGRRQNHELNFRESNIKISF